MATEMLMRSGIAAKRMSKPPSRSAPQMISTEPTNGPITPGAGIPIWANRPAPSVWGYRNFWIPSKKNTVPTIRRMSTTAAGAWLEVSLVSVFMLWSSLSGGTPWAQFATPLRFRSEHSADHQANEHDGGRRLAGGEFGFSVYVVVLSFGRDAVGSVRHAASLFFS